MQTVLQSRSGQRVLCPQARPTCVRRTARSGRIARCSAVAEHEQFQASLVKATAVGSAVSTLLAAGNVSAAQELADIAAADGRFGALALFTLPVFAWVGFNIFGPALNQLSEMQKKTSLRSMVGLSLGLATLMAAQHANAADASDVADAAAQAVQAVTAAKRDGRIGIIATLLIPVGGWVLFNITGPALAQLNNMNKKVQGRRGIAGALGLTAAGLLAAQQADAAQAAGRDGRIGIIATLLIPVGGWVLFNITGPALAQLGNMNKKLKGPGRRKGIAGAVGLSAAALMGAQQADAADLVTSAARDGRIGIIATLLIPVGGWVLFNITGPALAQLNNMNKKLSKGRR